MELIEKQRRKQLNFIKYLKGIKRSVIWLCELTHYRIYALSHKRMMKDYYKILGLRDSASGEEIRARWVELVKDCHHDPELGMEFDERVKEINEAYQVLKNPSTKLEYDFQREMDVKIKKFKINKWLPRVGLLIVLLILCFIYFENPQLPVDLTSRPPTSIASQPGAVSSAPVKIPEPSQSAQSVPPPKEVAAKTSEMT